MPSLAPARSGFVLCHAINLTAHCACSASVSLCPPFMSPSNFPRCPSHSMLRNQILLMLAVPAPGSSEVTMPQRVSGVTHCHHHLTLAPFQKTMTASCEASCSSWQFGARSSPPPHPLPQLRSTIKREVYPSNPPEVRRRTDNRRKHSELRQEGQHDTRSTTVDCRMYVCNPSAHKPPTIVVSQQRRARRSASLLQLSLQKVGKMVNAVHKPCLVRKSTRIGLF